MKLADKAWFIERIKPYLMPGEFVRESKGCVRFFSEVGGDQYQNKHLWICAPTRVVSPPQHVVCHLASIVEGSRYATYQALTPRRTGKDWKERMLEDFMNISGLKGRDLEACRKARTRKKILYSSPEQDVLEALIAAGHTVTHAARVDSTKILEQLNRTDVFLCFDPQEELFNLGVAFALSVPCRTTFNLPKLLEELDK